MTDLKPLPQTKKIPMPPGFPNQCFGDVAMIVEFVNTFKKFLIHSISVDAGKRTVLMNQIILLKKVAFTIFLVFSKKIRK